MTSPLPKDECSSLIVLTGSLGDVARGLPLAAAIKSARPEGHVSWVVERRWAPLVSLSRHVDRVVVFAREQGVRGAARLIRELRERHYDVSFDLQRILKSGAIAWLAGAPRRVGFHALDAKEANHLLNNEYVPAFGDSVSKLRHYLAFAQHVGIEVPQPIDFGIREVDLARHLPEALRARDCVAVVVGASWPSKIWPVDRWSRLCELIAARTSFDVVLVGGKAASHAPGALASRRVVDLRGRTSLVELAATLAHARAAVGPDTGPGHVASAVGTPYVGVFGPTDPSRVAPWGCETLAVRGALPCDGCTRRHCRRGDASCMAAVSAEMAWERLGPLLSRETR